MPDLSADVIEQKVYFLDSYGCQNLERHIFPQPNDSEGALIPEQFKSVFSSTHNDWWKKHVAYIITYKNRHNTTLKKLDKKVNVEFAL